MVKFQTSFFHEMKTVQILHTFMTIGLLKVIFNIALKVVFCKLQKFKNCGSYSRNG